MPHDTACPGMSISGMMRMPRWRANSTASRKSSGWYTLAGENAPFTSLGRAVLLNGKLSESIRCQCSTLSFL